VTTPQDNFSEEYKLIKRLRDALLRVSWMPGQQFDNIMVIRAADTYLINYNNTQGNDTGSNT
jgi:hypothetical protein